MGRLGFSTAGLRIAFVAFNKHIATEITSRLAGLRTLLEGSEEQQAIWHEAIHGTRHMLINAVAGCLAGDTEIGINRGGKSYKGTISYLYKMFNGGIQSNRSFDPAIETRIRSVGEDGIVRLAKVHGVYASGIKPTWTVELADGRQIRATEDHKFYVASANGVREWLPLSMLRGGLTLVYADSGKGGANSFSKPTYKYCYQMDHHPFRSVTHNRGVAYYRVPEHRLMVEAALNGYDLFHLFLNRVQNGDVAELIFLDPQEYVVHHADQNPRNNDLDNLVVMTPQEHKAHHAEENWRNVQAHVAPVRVASVTPFGEEETFDITMEDSTAPNFLANGIVVHNSGKTTTGMQYCFRVKGSVDAMTYHSLGLQALKKAYGRVDVDQYKVHAILDNLNIPVAKDQEKLAHAKIRSLVGLAKQYGVPIVQAQGETDETRDALGKIVDLHDLDMNGMEEMVLDWTPKVLQRCAQQTRVVDFDDMIWLPYHHRIPMPDYDMMITDEAQDLNAVQQWCALQSADRHMVVGDFRQAIYAFRGSDSKSMERMKASLEATGRGVVELPLTYTRRCPKSHVALAQRIFGAIQPLPDAPDGIVRYEPNVDKAIAEMREGDLVLCRTNADLLGVAYKLLKRRVRVVVRGRDLGTGLIRMIEKAEKKAGMRDGLAVAEMLSLIWEETRQEIQRLEALPNERGMARAQAAQDKFDCLSELSAAKTSGEVKAVINQLFEKTDGENGGGQDAVVLGTVHRTKGLESERVWVLRPELIPHPMAKRPEEQIQERNIGYIACTRARFVRSAISGFLSEGELVFVGKESPLFSIGGLDAEN